jgi:polar amino acid transport system ATP-binding protein
MAESKVSIENVGKYFRGHKVLDHVDLAVAAGEVVSIIGPSGAGKSTLLRCINFLEDFQEGSITVDGEPVGYDIADGRRTKKRESDVVALRRHVGMVFQSFNLFGHCTALDNVALGPMRVLGMSRADARGAALAQLEKVGLGDRADYLPSKLSGGQQQRVAIARALAMQPSVLLLDEITSALDPELVGEVLGVVQQLASEGLTMILVTHEMQFAKDVSHRIAFMEAGTVRHVGCPDELLGSDSPARIREFMNRYLHGGAQR